MRSIRGAFAALALLMCVLSAVGLIVSSNPALCALCHTRQADSLASSPHSGIGCYDCHLPAGGWSLMEAKANEVFSMYPAFASGGAVTGSGTRISRAACVACHPKVLSGTSSARGLRVRHAECAAAPAKCDSCHSDAAHAGTARHVRRVDMGECIACHTAENVTGVCRSCHVREPAVTKPTTGTLGVVHGPGSRETHAMADERACRTCHEPAFCDSCHGTLRAHPAGFALVHGKAALKPGATCTSCHKDPTMCADCHGLPMPHPASFQARHAKAATSLADARCRQCHTEQECRDCHTRHAHPTTTDGTIPSSRLPKSRSVPR
ncbi:MAG: hypothetical protein Q7W16_07245 [Coriobacteriia bacterium]|nr:hypothetical protein [Coriobacteriia bacterium]